MPDADNALGLPAADVDDDARRDVSTRSAGAGCLDAPRRPPRDEPEPGRSPVALAWMKSSSVTVSNRYWGGGRDGGCTWIVWCGVYC